MKRVRKEELEALQYSELFDEKWYLEQYPDVKMLGMSAIEHYLWVGAKLGRNPSRTFGTTNYLDLHQDVAAASVNPLYHYIRWGRKEGRTLDSCISESNKIDSETVFINRGPYRIKRQYKEFDWDRQTNFLNFVDASLRHNVVNLEDILVTIVMPTFNRAGEIGRAIESVCSQSHRNWTLIIADDGSTDNTKEVVDSFGENERIKYVLLDHVGVSGARNAGLKLSKGKYIAYLDSDNTWNREFLRSMIVFMEKHDLDASYAGIRALDDDENIVCYRGDVFVWSACKAANYVDLNPFMHRRDLAFAEGKEVFFDTNLKRVVDWDFILRLTARAKVSYAPFIGVNYYDGDDGNRITRTEYQNGEMPQIIAAVRAKHSERSPAHDCLDTGSGMALSAPSRSQYEAYPQSRPLIFYPDYTVANAYQTLINEHLDGFDVRAGDIDECLRQVFLRRSDQIAPVVFHLHWLNPVFAPARDESEAEDFVGAFLSKARLFVSLGGRIIWTIHNVISHEPKYLDQELRLSRALTELADWIHVHHASVADATKPYYELPAHKVLVAEHGNYIGTLPDNLTRQQARSELGIPDTHRVFLFLGQIRGYKGIDELIEAFSELGSKHDDCWLVIAGKVLGISQAEIERKLHGCHNVVFRPGYVPDDRMQVYLKSADVVALPYRKVLTSGSVFLAMSFGLPVICPRAGLLSHIVEDGRNGLLYGSEEAAGLLQAMRRFIDMPAYDADRMRESAYRTAQSYRWEETSAKLRRHIEGADFGEIMWTEIEGNRRAWFVRGDLEALKNKRCIAIVLHYQNLEDTRECIERLQKQGQDIGVILISNAETLHDIRELAGGFPEIVSVQSEDNIGYAAANNFGLLICRQSGAEFFWILNPDIVVPDGYYDQIIERTESWPDHDFFGSSIVPSHQPGKAIFCGGEVRLDQGARPGHLYMGRLRAELPAEPFECDYLTGANIFGRTSALAKAEYMPEHYFLYFEETDWFLEMQANRALRKPVVFPDMYVENHKRSENGLVPSRYYIYYFIRNSLLFGIKFAAGRTDICMQEARKFADAWLKKIARGAPDRLGEFQELVERAIEDGSNGRVGRVVLDHI